MKLVAPPLEIDEQNPFANDLFDRKPFAEALRNLVDRTSDELVISIDGDWGQGKTTFVKMWQGLLAESNIHSLYIDVFERDFVDDAFVTIASAITAYAEEHQSRKEQVAEFKDKAKKVGGRLLSWSTRMAIRAATLGALRDADLEELKEIHGDLASGVSSAVGDFLDDRLSAHARDVEMVEAFKEELSALPDALDGDSQKLVIIIDELDRCRPTFALAILEKIKHLFSVKNIVFVLVMHRTQLEEAVKCLYGPAIDARTYLMKFINLETRLPSPRNPRNDETDIGRYCRNLFAEMEIESWGESEDLLACVESLVLFYQLSLRQIERIMTGIAVYYSTAQERHLHFIPLIAFLSVTKVVNAELFELILRDNTSYPALCEGAGIPKNVGNEGVFASVMGGIEFCLLSEDEYRSLEPNSWLRRYEHLMSGYRIGRRRILQLHAEHIALFNVPKGQ